MGSRDVMPSMAIDLETPDVAELDDVVQALGRWQRDGTPIQLHPGDLGWQWRFGAAPLAAAVRIWKRDREIVAAGFLDGPDVFRLAVAPERWRDDQLARDVVAQVSGPQHGILPAGKASVEVPDGTRIQELLSDGAWRLGESWTPLRRALTSPVAQSDLHVEVVDSSGQVSACTAVHQSAWGPSRFTDALWRTMAAGSPFANARCLLARDHQGVAVATVTVWSAGPGRPGLIEPLGVHHDHRRRGYGAAICVAAAAHLRQLGASSALVCTPTSLQSAVSTYESAGFEKCAVRLDRTREV